MDSAATIALDGPVASGKTAVGRLLARKLGYRFLDTGVMYRAITWAAIEAAISPEDVDGLATMTRQRPVEVVFRQDGEALVKLSGKDIMSHLWQQQVEQMVSMVAQAPGVRDILTYQQRQIALEGPVVMVGRDIGTVVLPEAKFKLFLTASVNERARRRHAELHALGQKVPYRQVLEELMQRDGLDSGRQIAPLRPAADAHVITTDGLSVSEVVDNILKLIGQ